MILLVFGHFATRRADLLAAVLFSTFFLGMCAYQLVSGRLFNGHWETWTTREERPWLYWTVVLLQTGAGVIGTLLMFQSIVAYWAGRN